MSWFFDSDVDDPYQSTIVALNQPSSTLDVVQYGLFIISDTLPPLHRLIGFWVCSHLNKATPPLRVCTRLMPSRSYNSSR